MTSEDPNSIGADSGIESIRTLAAICCSGIRLEILRELALGPNHVGDIAERLELDASHVSHRLRDLRTAGLVEMACSKHFHIYELSQMVRVEERDGKLVFKLCSQTGHHLTVELPAKNAD